jgi:hypothetical protein
VAPHQGQGPASPAALTLPPWLLRTAQAGPRPDSFGAQRRLAAHRDEPLLFEAELVRVREAEELSQVGGLGAEVLCSIGPKSRWLRGCLAAWLLS